MRVSTSLVRQRHRNSQFEPNFRGFFYHQCKDRAVIISGNRNSNFYLMVVCLSEVHNYWTKSPVGAKKRTGLVFKEWWNLKLKSKIISSWKTRHIVKVLQGNSLSYFFFPLRAEFRDLHLSGQCCDAIISLSSSYITVFYAYLM